MSPAVYPIAAFVVAYVASEPVAQLIPGVKARPSRQIVIEGAIAAVLAYLVLGMPAAWLAALLVGLVAAVGASLDQTKSAAGFLWVRIVALLVIAAIGAWLVPNVSPGARSLLWPAGWYDATFVLAAAYVTVEWGRMWVERAIKPFAASVTFPEGEDQGLPNGGRMIGQLERLLIYLFVLIDAPTAIGFLVTAKSILRFGEIKDKESHRLAEYIIIGTLMSFGFAVVAAYLAKELVSW